MTRVQEALDKCEQANKKVWDAQEQLYAAKIEAVKAWSEYHKIQRMEGHQQ